VRRRRGRNSMLIHAPTKDAVLRVKVGTLGAVWRRRVCQFHRRWLSQDKRKRGRDV